MVKQEFSPVYLRTPVGPVIWEKPGLKFDLLYQEMKQECWIVSDGKISFLIQSILPKKMYFVQLLHRFIGTQIGNRFRREE